MYKFPLQRFSFTLCFLLFRYIYVFCPRCICRPTPCFPHMYILGAGERERARERERERAISGFFNYNLSEVKDRLNHYGQCACNLKEGLKAKKRTRRHEVRAYIHCITSARIQTDRQRIEALLDQEKLSSAVRHQIIAPRTRNSRIRLITIHRPIHLHTPT